MKQIILLFFMLLFLVAKAQIKIPQQQSTTPVVRPAQPQTATLKILSNAEGTIKIDGDSFGKIEENGIKKVELKSGNYFVQLFPSDGRRVVDEEVSLKAGQTETVKLEIKEPKVEIVKPEPKQDKEDEKAVVDRDSYTSKPPNKKGYEIKVKIDNYDSDILLLGYRMGSKTFVADTAVGKDSKGFFVFKSDTYLKGGVYLILTKPDNHYFEFLIGSNSDQHFNLSTLKEGADMLKNLKVTGSEDNQLFFEYIRVLGKRDSEELDNFQKNIFAKYTGFLTVNLIKAAQNPTVPKKIEDQGQLASYNYFKEHYFDGFDFGDNRLIRTPVLEQKIEYYLDKLTVQKPDSIIVSCEYLIANVKKAESPEVLQFVVAHILNKYAIKDEKVYFHIGNKYYCGAEIPNWIDPDQLEKICKNIDDLRNRKQ